MINKEFKKNFLYFMACMFGGLLAGFMTFLMAGTKELQVVTFLLITGGLWFELRFRRLLGQAK